MHEARSKQSHFDIKISQSIINIWIRFNEAKCTMKERFITCSSITSARIDFTQIFHRHFMRIESNYSVSGQYPPFVIHYGKFPISK